MPLFDYVCQGCDHQFEALQAMNDSPLTDCPSCNQPRLKKQVAAPAFTFKGGGWYKDLYSSNQGSEKPSADKPASAGSSSGSSSDSASGTSSSDTKTTAAAAS